MGLRVSPAGVVGVLGLGIVLWAAPGPAGAPAAGPREAEQALIAAAERGDLAGLRAALGRGARIDARDGRGRTALLAATHGNQVETFRALIAAGADVNLQDHRMDNPLLYAGAEGRLEILRLAIQAGADPRITNRFGGTALIPAAERGHVEVVRELLERTAVEVNHVNRLGWTALLEAIVLSDGGPRHQRIVALLLAHGADVNLPDRGGITPRQHARSRGFEAIEQLLAGAGAR